MIISASRRTDIPAFYSNWFYNRIKAGFVDVRNPVNVHQISRISLSPKEVDCIVFWSKNPAPMLARLDELEAYKYYFQFTINPYDSYLERFVPAKKQVITTFRDLSERIGGQRVIWRYDPILISKEIDMEHHIKYFEELARCLEGYTSLSIISFIDLYKKTLFNIKDTDIRELREEEMSELAGSLVSIAHRYGITVQSCAEKIDLSRQGVAHAKCIDETLIRNIVGYPLKVKKDCNQRKECECIQSIDIGEYDTCMHNCLYCYANYTHARALQKHLDHDENSSLLIGQVGEKDRIKERTVCSLRDNSLF